VCPQKDCRDNLVYFADLDTLPGGKREIAGKVALTQVVFKLEFDFQYVTNAGSKCIFRTNKAAPNYCLLSIDLAKPEAENWNVLLKEDEANVLEWATCVNEDKLVVCHMEDVKNTLKVFDLTTGGYLYDFPLEIGSIVGLSGKKTHSELFYKFSSMIMPGIIYHVDMTESKPVPKVSQFGAKCKIACFLIPFNFQMFMETEISGFDQSEYKVEQVFYPSKDGTKIPMFIASRKEEKRDSSSPCLLYGYGGFNISLTPSFSITQLFFIQHFGYMAIPNIRGGGEYGERWHNAGRLLNKQNCFDDFQVREIGFLDQTCLKRLNSNSFLNQMYFQAAGEYLIKEGYTRKEKLAIQGGSNGGLLVGACINQRPELFGAGIAAVG
jgi:prolyl oligopeptidase